MYIYIYIYIAYKHVQVYVHWNQQIRNICWIPFGDHPSNLERYRED